MQIAVNESTYPVMAAIKWVHTYVAMLATPLRVLDVLAGHVGFVLLRLVVTSATFCAIVAGFGARPSRPRRCSPSRPPSSPASPSPRR